MKKKWNYSEPPKERIPIRLQEIINKNLSQLDGRLSDKQKEQVLLNLWMEAPQKPEI